MKENLKAIEKYLRSIDPFKIPLDKYRSLINNDEYSNLVNRVITKRLDELYGSWIKKKLKETGTQSIVVCDGKVIYSSKNRYEPSDKELNEMEEKMAKPCYIITGEPLIEEQSNWSYLSVNDYYPTIEIYTGRMNWNDEDVFKKGTKVRSDFDTGNPEYIALNEELCRNIVKDVPIRRIGYHLGMPYIYYPRKMKVGITDKKQNRCLGKIIEGVDNWDHIELNPYKIANPNREGFVGRDLMLKLFVRITLDPSLKESRWKLL